MALSAARNTPAWAPLSTIRSYPQKASSTIYAGSLVVLDTNKQAVAGTLATATLVVGRASITQTVGSSVTLTQIQVEEGIFGFSQHGTAFDYQDVGSFCYVYDDATVTLNSSGASIAGTVQRVDDDGTVWVEMGLPGADDSTAAAAVANDLAAEIVALAATTSPGGASLIGVFDTATLYSAADVEAALAEVMKKANAGLASPVAVHCVLSTAATGSTVFSFVPGYAGKIATLDGSVEVVASTTATATFQVYISDTAVTGASLALTNVNCATLGHRISGTVASGSNTFTATQVISIQMPTGPTKFTEGAVALCLFLASA